MADKRITELSAVSAVDFDNDLLPIVNGGFTKKITARALADNFESISYQGSDLKALSANWQSTFSTVSTISANWDSVYTTVSINSANWDSTYSTMSSLSSFWQDTQTAVAQNSATWQDTYTTVSTKSASWDAAVFNQEVTYTDELTGLNACLRVTINGSTKYIRLFEIGTELFEFSTEDAVDLVSTEDDSVIFFE